MIISRLHINKIQHIITIDLGEIIFLELPKVFLLLILLNSEFRHERHSKNRRCKPNMNRTMYTKRRVDWPTSYQWEIIYLTIVDDPTRRWLYKRVNIFITCENTRPARSRGLNKGIPTHWHCIVFISRPHKRDVWHLQLISSSMPTVWQEKKLLYDNFCIHVGVYFEPTWVKDSLEWFL